ncbi:MAG: isochorismatase family protein, partial [Butyrivibrio hungatei]|nr:isochorismatase family protein [Butyrivibrio hungatei]
MPDSKVLLVIDLQNDYLWDKRKPMFTYATDNLINNVNKAIASYRGSGYDIIYIKHILPDNAFVRNLVGFSVEGSEGADIYRGVN